MNITHLSLFFDFKKSLYIDFRQCRSRVFQSKEHCFGELVVSAAILLQTLAEDLFREKMNFPRKSSI